MAKTFVEQSWSSWSWTRVNGRRKKKQNKTTKLGLLRHKNLDAAGVQALDGFGKVPGESTTGRWCWPCRRETGGRGARWLPPPGRRIWWAARRASSDSCSVLKDRQERRTNISGGVGGTNVAFFFFSPFKRSRSHSAAGVNQRWKINKRASAGWHLFLCGLFDQQWHENVVENFDGVAQNNRSSPWCGHLALNSSSDKTLSENVRPSYSLFSYSSESCVLWLPA